MIRLEQNIPVPIPRSQHAVWPFRDMKVGDSFLIPTDRSIAGLRASFYWYKQTNPSLKTMEITVRKLKSEGCPQYRCWRIK